MHLEPVLRQVVNELRHDDGATAIETDFVLDRLVNCDSSRIAQMVSNLLGNALTHGARNEPVRVIARADASGIVIAVANAGKAIPPDAMDRLFQPFVRGGSKANQSRVSASGCTSRLRSPKRTEAASV